MGHETKVDIPADVLEKIVKAVQKSPFAEEPHSVFIFGSRAEGRASERSDVDIGIISQRSRTASERETLRELLEDISCPYVFEVVDFQDVPSGFRDYALRHSFFLN